MGWGSAGGGRKKQPFLKLEKGSEHVEEALWDSPTDRNSTHPSVWSHSLLLAPFLEKVKPCQPWENTWTSHLTSYIPLTLSPLSHQTLKINNFCLQSLDMSPSCALIAFGPPALVSHTCKLHESGFSGDHLKLAGHLRWKNSPLVHALLFGLWSLCCDSVQEKWHIGDCFLKYSKTWLQVCMQSHCKKNFALLAFEELWS